MPSSNGGCQCDLCVRDGAHDSDCAVHNGFAIGPCDCRQWKVTRYDEQSNPIEMFIADDHGEAVRLLSFATGLPFGGYKVQGTTNLPSPKIVQVDGGTVIAEHYGEE